MPEIYCTVTTDLSSDQRMIRICGTLAAAGYAVVLVGRKRRSSLPLTAGPFRQKRIGCFFEKGKLFYAEYSLRLFFYLLFKRADCLCAVDLDTILPVLAVSKIKRIKRVYDAHELFCEMKEIATRPRVYKFWKSVESYAVPQFPRGYTVNEPIAAEFRKMYGLSYAVIRNISVAAEFHPVKKDVAFVLYQGAVNEGRSFETLIPAMKEVEAQLLICGDGNFMAQAKELVTKNALGDRVIFKGVIPPGKLREITRQATVGITLFDDRGLSNYYSLANRFFDYMHAGVPQLCVDYPVYREINEAFEIAVLTADISAKAIAAGINRLLNDKALYDRLAANCMLAAGELSWQNEEKKLIRFYQSLFE